MICAEVNHRRLLRSRGAAAAAVSLPGFGFATIPDVDATQDKAAFCSCLGPPCGPQPPRGRRRAHRVVRGGGRLQRGPWPAAGQRLRLPVARSGGRRRRRAARPGVAGGGAEIHASC